jgi:cytochrome P450
MQNDVNNIYLKKCAAIFEIDIERFLSFRIANLMPFLARPIYHLLFGLINVRKALMKLLPFLSNYIQEIPTLWLLNNVQKVVNVRIESSATNSVKRIDLLQVMIVVLFMIAGYEIIATSLAYSTYILATQPDVQEKLVEEINEKTWNNNEADELYDIATNLSYLDMFVREVLRMYPIVSRQMARECNTTTTVCGHIIEKDFIL